MAAESHVHTCNHGCHGGIRTRKGHAGRYFCPPAYDGEARGPCVVVCASGGGECVGGRGGAGEARVDAVRGQS
eukprot:40170-Eustigmatos_ZCMA.PRE.1